MLIVFAKRIPWKAIVLNILLHLCAFTSCGRFYDHSVIENRWNPYPGFRFRPVNPAALTMFKPTSLCQDTNDGGPPYRYHKETQQCYLVGSRGPCGKLMAFTMIDDDYGTCDCDQSLRCGRPLIYWPETKRCYYVNDQGPCSPGKWLVFGLSQNPVCKRNACKAETTKNPSRGVNFWFQHQKKCYRTGTQGFCEEGQVLLNSWEDYKPRCHDLEYANCKRRLPVQRTSCLPGMKTDYSERCMRNPFRGQPVRYGQQQKLPNIYHLSLQ